MRFCKYCGNQVSDSATFCGVCGHELTPQGGIGNPTGGMRQGGFNLASLNVGSTNSNLISMVQGILMLVLAAASLFLPLVESSSLIQASTGLSFSFNMASLVSSASSFSQYGDMLTGQLSSSLTSQLSSSLGSLSDLVSLEDGMGRFSFWMTVVSILLAVAMVGTFITSARCLENTSKSTLVTGWLFVPYAIVSFFVVNGVASEVNDFVVGLAAASGSSSGIVGSLEVLHTTLWPWLVLLLALACGVLGIVRYVSMQPSARS